MYIGFQSTVEVYYFLEENGVFVFQLQRLQAFGYFPYIWPFQLFIISLTASRPWVLPLLLTLHAWATVQFPRKHYKMGGITCHRMAQTVCLLLRVRSDQGSIRGSQKNNPNTSSNLDAFTWRLLSDFSRSFWHFSLPFSASSQLFTLHLHSAFCMLSRYVAFQSPWGIISCGSSAMAVDVIDLQLHF